MASNPLIAFGTGSGLDSRAIVDSLVSAERTNRSQPVTRRVETLTARISALGQLQSALTGIATSLDTRVRSGELGLAVASSDAAVAVERLGSGPPAPLVNGLSVNRLASGQRLNSPPFTSASDPVGLGTLSFIAGRRTPDGNGGFSFAAGGQAPVNISITAQNNSLAGLARAINDSAAGVTASIVASQGRATLVLRGAEGAENAFIISAAPSGGPPGLERFNHTPGAETMALGEAARDAELVIDGVAVTRPANRIDDLVPGVRLTLRRETGNAVISAARDGSALSGALADFVGTLQAMRQLIGDFRKPAQGGEAPGPLATDGTARRIDQQLVRLVTLPIAQAGGLRLSDLGVNVLRDGTISVDAARLANLPPTRLADAEALLREVAGPARADRPARLLGIAATVGTATSGLTRQRDGATAELARIDIRVDQMRSLLTRQFAAMDTSVGQSRAAAQQLTQLMEMWTADSGR
ncbi:MAG: flagellar filament capping protein FliD [Alphaproteobacteria bacterium]|nr:flagellar filament capping protein FliD [Alphaproteobacteria bacterium]